MSATAVAPVEQEGTVRQTTLIGWTTSVDHKRIGLLTIGTSLLLFFSMGAIALLMRAQLAQPNQDVVSAKLYNELFTLHGSGMIYLVVTPFAIGLGTYLVPLQVGAPRIAAPRVAALGYWVYLAGAVAILSGFITRTGTAQGGWWSYPPLSDSRFTPGRGVDLWILGVFLAVSGMILLSASVLWTALRMRAPHMTMLRLPVFTWSMIVSCFMVVGAFPSLLAALGLLTAGRFDANLFNSNVWNLGYQDLFWFYGHPVVYVMFFPFVGCVAEVLQTFSRRRFFGYKVTVLSLMAFAALSMSVWGHHLFASGQVKNDYYSLTSICLSVPAGVEYFGFIMTLIGGRLRFPTPMLFALAFIPQFLVGGLTGIMVATPVIDYHVNDSYFVLGHFHYTLLAGSVFGLMAGIYYWWPKATGVMFSERLGKLHFWLMTIGTNVTFLPMFALGYLGMPRRVATYPTEPGFGTLNLVSSCGAALLGVSMLVFALNIVVSLRRRAPAPPDPWGGVSLEWATSSPPPLYNFTAIPPIRSYAPMLDLAEQAEETAAAAAGEAVAEAAAVAGEGRL